MLYWRKWFFYDNVTYVIVKINMYTIQYMYGLNIQTSVVGYLQYWAVNTYTQYMICLKLNA